MSGCVLSHAIRSFRSFRCYRCEFSSVGFLVTVPFCFIINRFFPHCLRFSLFRQPVEPPGRMTAAAEASSIRAPDAPVTIHYSTAPVPRYLRLPSTTAPPLCPGVSSYHPLHSYRTVGSPRRRRRPVILPPKRKSSTATRKQHRRVSQPFLARVCSFRGVCDLQQ